MNCYKCNSDQELSAKKIDYHGNITFICRSCRRADYRARRPSHNSKTSTVTKEWAALAKQRNSDLSLKYRDEGFMRAKGLI